MTAEFKTEWGKHVMQFVGRTVANAENDILRLSEENEEAWNRYERGIDDRAKLNYLNAQAETLIRAASWPDHETSRKASDWLEKMERYRKKLIAKLSGAGEDEPERPSVKPDISSDDLTPDGLTLSEDGTLLNWKGENYLRQKTATILEVLKFEDPWTGNEHWRLEFSCGHCDTDAAGFFPTYCRVCGAKIEMDSVVLPKGK